MPPSPPLAAGRANHPPFSYLPADLPVISPENAAQVVQVAWLAEDRLTGVTWSPDGDWMGAISLKGVTVYEAAALPPACYGEAATFLPPLVALSRWRTRSEGRFLSPGGQSLGVLRVDDFAVDLYDVDSGQLTSTLEWLEQRLPGALWSRFLAGLEHAGLVHARHIAPDGRRHRPAWADDGHGRLHPGHRFFPGREPDRRRGWGHLQRRVPAIGAGMAGCGWRAICNPGWLYPGQHRRRGEPVALFADGRYLMAGHSDGSIAVWNLPDGTPRMFIGGSRSNLPVTDLAMSADGESLLAAYANQTAINWDLTKSREPASWSGKQAAISPDAESVALLTADGWVKLFNAATNQEIATLGQNPYLSSLTFSPDSGYLGALSVHCLHYGYGNCLTIPSWRRFTSPRPGSGRHLCSGWNDHRRSVVRLPGTDLGRPQRRDPAHARTNRA